MLLHLLFGLAAAFAQTDYEFDLDRVFELSLDRMLDGFAVLVEGRRAV